MKQLRLLSMAILTITLCMVSCTGEDGANGYDGTDGENGINGDNGENGIDGAQGENGIEGENGQGFDELTKFGYINLELQGTRPDGIAFDDAASFKFTPVKGQFYYYYSSVERKEIEEGVFLHTFIIRRYLSAPNETSQQTKVIWELHIIDLGKVSQVVHDSTNILIDNYAVIGEDNKYFVMISGGYSPFFVEEVFDFEISDVTYDTTTNNLTFSYSMLVDASVNDSGNDLNISGTVDVIVLEKIIN